ncbi:MAG: hypothetical protein HZB83_08625, partial [Deltaproteobacteria bacterium]|nr:hypothetical protein [Deltaproteobacteria bacterium]
APRGGGLTYFETGKRDFTADLVMTTASKDAPRRMRINGRLAKRGVNFRSDIDMTGAFNSEGKEAVPPPAFLKTVFLKRADEDKTYTLYPDMKKYIEHTVEKGGRKKPQMDKERLGIDTIDGRRADKYRVTFTDDRGNRHQGLIWEANDIENFVIRAEFEEEGTMQVMELKNVRPGSPPPALFQIPEDYVRAGSFIELMMQDANRPDKNGK